MIRLVPPVVLAWLAAACSGPLPPGSPVQAYAGALETPGNVRLVSTPEGFLVVAMGRDRATWTAIDDLGHQAWTRELPCPKPGGPLRLKLEGGRALCNTGQGWIAVGLEEGEPLGAAEPALRLGLEAGPDGRMQLRARSDTGETSWSAAVLPTTRRFVTSEGVVLVQGRRPEVLIARDLAEGQLLWAEDSSLSPEGSFLKDASPMFGVRDDGYAYVGRWDPRSRLAVQEHPWPFQGRPAVFAAGPEGRTLLFGAVDGVLVLDERDAPLLSRPIPVDSDLSPVVAALSDKAALILFAGETTRQIRYWQLGQPQAPSGMPPVAKQPEWMTRGTTLVYVVQRHTGVDPLSGEANGQPVVTRLLLSEASPTRVTWQTLVDGTAVFSRDLSGPVLARARAHLDSIDPEEPLGERTTMRVSRAVMRDLVEGGRAAFQDTTAGATTHLRALGRTYHRLFMTVGEGAKTAAVPADLPCVVAESEPEGSRYWIARFADHPIIVRAERPNHRMWLAAITLRPRKKSKTPDAEPAR